MVVEQPESRRARRAQDRRARSGRGRAIRWTLVALGVLLVASLAWVGIRALLARGELEAAVPLAQKIQQQVIDGDADLASSTFESLNTHAQAAESLTDDIIWRAYEWVPFAGPNLTAVREMASVVAQVSDEGIRPLTQLAGKLDPSSLKPVDHTIALDPLIAAQPTVHEAATALESAYQRVDRIDSDPVLGLVRDALDRLHSAVTKARDAVDSVDRTLRLAPAMLGADGPRNYLLLIQNPAELRSTGGIPGALALIHTENGRIDLVQQASTADFSRFPAPVLELPTDTRALYGSITAEYIQDVTLTPQFPLAAELAREMWRQQYGLEVDGVLAVDPFVLSYLLEATGPVTLSTGDQLDADNAVQVLLSDVYARYPKSGAQDAFFAEAASAAFSLVVSGEGDPKKLLAALAKAASERRVLVWSAHDEDQEVLAGTRLTGELPKSNSKIQRIGVYQNDATMSKMDYYLTTEITVGTAVCRSDGRANLSVAITMTSAAPPDAATSLPEYVTGGVDASIQAGSISTIVYVYGPPDSINLGTKADFERFGVHPTLDGIYPVTSFQIDLAPGESKTVHISMLTGQAFNGSIEALPTPGINTHVTYKLASGC